MDPSRSECRHPRSSSLASCYSDPERIECVMLASSGTKAVREPEKLRFVYRVEHFDHRSLDDLVFQRGNTQRPFAAIRLRNHPAP